jgi:hypothetical protein
MIVYEALGEIYVTAIFHGDGTDANFHHAYPSDFDTGAQVITAV